MLAAVDGLEGVDGPMNQPSGCYFCLRALVTPIPAPNAIPSGSQRPMLSVRTPLIDPNMIPSPMAVDVSFLVSLSFLFLKPNMARGHPESASN